MPVATEPNTGPLIYLIAGEASGDQLGGRLMAEIKKQTGGNVRFAGIGGARMSAEGLESAFPMAELSVMGLAEVVPHLPRIMQRISETVMQVERMRPAVLVTIDSPDFTLRVSRKLKDKGIPLVHYVAPTVWAWKSGRAGKTAEFLDHMMALFPFEPPYFERVGLDCTFVGHPVVDGGAEKGDGPNFRAQHGIPNTAIVLCALPGSRRGEVRRLLPIYRQVFNILGGEIPELYVVMPVAHGVAEEVDRFVSIWPAGLILVQGEAQRYDAFQASDLALAASGTVALELAVAGVPGVVAYKLNLVTAWLARAFVKVRYVNLINLLMDQEVIPELILERCEPKRIAASLWNLYDDREVRQAQIKLSKQAMSQLSVSGISPSQRAAQVVLAHVTEPSFAGWLPNR